MLAEIIFSFLFASNTVHSLEGLYFFQATEGIVYLGHRMRDAPRTESALRIAPLLNMARTSSYIK